jgi:hypothetical protein
MLTGNFLVMQLDLRGTRDITDFDGNVLTESALAAKWQVSGSIRNSVYGV